MSDETFTQPTADRAPTPDEEAAAERAAHDIDLAEVGKQFRESTERGANIKGEGEIVPPGNQD